MKPAPRLFLIACIIIFSCKKADTGLYKPELIASWHLLSFGNLLFPQTPADSVTLTLQTSGKYIRTSNTTITETGTFKLTEEKNTAGENETIIHFSSQTIDDYKSYMRIANDTLVLTPIAISTD